MMGIPNRPLQPVRSATLIVGRRIVKQRREQPRSPRRSVTVSRHDFYSLIEDEELARQYHVRLTYESEGFDPGDWTTPPCSSEMLLVDLAVLQARHYDADGELCVLEMNSAAQTHRDRVRQLIRADASLIQRLEESPLR